MSNEFKVGEEYEVPAHSVDSGSRLKIIKVEPRVHVTYEYVKVGPASSMLADKRMTRLQDDRIMQELVKVEPFFEIGKQYRHKGSGRTFICQAVYTEQHGPEAGSKHAWLVADKDDGWASTTETMSLSWEEV